MSTSMLPWLWPLTHLVTALGFLLLGWKLGRESVGRPMFDFPPSTAETVDPGPECDPWQEAASGLLGPGVGVDRNKTVFLP